MMNNRDEIVLYQAENSIQLEVRVEDETVWLTQAQMVLLFERDQSVISRHINNVFSVCPKTHNDLLYIYI
jgi:hypothetical protein